MVSPTTDISQLETAVFLAAERGLDEFRVAVTRLAQEVEARLGSRDKAYDEIERDLLLAVDAVHPDQRDDFLNALSATGLPLAPTGPDVDPFIITIIERNDVEWLDALARTAYPFYAPIAHARCVLDVVVIADRPELIPWFIAHGAPVEGCADNGGSPLHGAVDMDRAECIQALLKAGADPYSLDREDRTPAYRAVLDNKHRAFKALLSAGINVSRLHSEGGDLKDLLDVIPQGPLFVECARQDARECIGDVAKSMVVQRARQAQRHKL